MKGLFVSRSWSLWCKTEQSYCFGPLRKNGAEQTVHTIRREKSKRRGGRNAYRPLANAHPDHSSMISQKPRCPLLCPGSFAGRQSQRKSRTWMSPDDWG